MTRSSASRAGATGHGHHRRPRFGRVRLMGRQDDVREYVHVEDAARLSVDAAGDDFADQHLTITGPNQTRLRDLFTMFSEILGREVLVDYVPPHGHDHVHYRITPSSWNPKVGRKLTSSCYVDMGQGLLQILDDLHGDGEPGTVASDADPG